MRTEATLALAIFAAELLVGCSPKSGARKPSKAPDEATAIEARPVFAEAPAAPAPLPVGAGSEAILSLRTPHARAEAQRVLDDFLRAIVRESSADLAQLFTEDATLHYGDPKSGGSAAAGWSVRFARRDYTGENPAGLYDAERLEVYTARDVVADAEQEGLAFTPRGSEVVLRVPLSPNNPSGRFGDELQLLLTPGEGGLRIRHMFERGYTER